MHLHLIACAADYNCLCLHLPSDCICLCLHLPLFASAFDCVCHWLHLLLNLWFLVHFLLIASTLDCIFLRLHIYLIACAFDCICHAQPPPLPDCPACACALCLLLFGCWNDLVWSRFCTEFDWNIVAIKAAIRLQRLYPIWNAIASMTNAPPPPVPVLPSARASSSFFASGVKATLCNQIFVHISLGIALQYGLQRLDPTWSAIASMTNAPPVPVRHYVPLRARASSSSLSSLSMLIGHRAIEILRIFQLKSRWHLGCKPSFLLGAP